MADDVSMSIHVYTCSKHKTFSSFLWCVCVAKCRSGLVVCIYIVFYLFKGRASVETIMMMTMMIVVVSFTGSSTNLNDQPTIDRNLI